MGLSSSLAAVEVITAEERAALRPAYLAAAIADVTAAFDPTYIPPADPEQPEETVTTSQPQPAPETTDDDLLAAL